jgi:twitching motility protein PilT
MHINNLLAMAVAKGASDLHIKVGGRPVLRIDGELVMQEELAAVTEEMMERLFQEISTEKLRETFAVEMEADFAYQLETAGRFRINLSRQGGARSIICRPVKTEIPTCEALGLPPVCRDLAMLKSGLVIVTGPTGCGKSTTLAAMMNYLNLHVKRKIITIEDPVEYVHHDVKSIFYQREIGRDTRSFANALKYALRQDPDVILVGEMRDLDTMSAVLTAAETGHLVLTTLHTPGAVEAINRFIDVFPPHHQQQVRTQFAAVLQGVIYQLLVPRAGGHGRIAAIEVLLASPAVRNLIREGKNYQIMNIIQTSAQQGMQSLNKALAALSESGAIERREALAASTDGDELKELFNGHLSK